VPGKLYGAMAAGRPIVFVGPEHCEPADTIRNAGCGFTLPAGDTSALVSSLSLLASDPSLARRMGERARTSFIAHFEQRLCCSRWCELIEETLAQPQRRILPQARSARRPEPAFQEATRNWSP
jgi:colanic acid biosynthesis glycosyl transferase WcaI